MIDQAELKGMKARIAEIRKDGAPCVLCQTHAWTDGVWFPSEEARIKRNYKETDLIVVIFAICQPCSTKRDARKLIEAAILRKLDAIVRPSA